MRTVIAFDVSDDRKRYRVVKILEDCAVRVQKSVFEVANLPTAAYLRLRSKLEGEIEPTTDALRYYRLCKGCGERIVATGVGPRKVDEDAETRVI